MVFEFGERSGVDDDLLDASDAVTVETRRSDLGEYSELRSVGSANCPGEQRRGLALAKVTADRLAREALLAERAHHVVAHLEGIAQRQSVGAECREQLVLALGGGEDGAEVQRSFDGVLAGLVPADPFGLVDVSDALHRSEDVEVLADVQLDAQLVPDPHRLGWGALHQPVGVHERQVADEDRDTFAESA